MRKKRKEDEAAQSAPLAQPPLPPEKPSAEDRLMAPVPLSLLTRDAVSSGHYTEPGESQAYRSEATRLSRAGSICADVEHVPVSRPPHLMPPPAAPVPPTREPRQPQPDAKLDGKEYYLGLDAPKFATEKYPYLHDESAVRAVEKAQFEEKDSEELRNFKKDKYPYLRKLDEED